MKKKIWELEVKMCEWSEGPSFTYRVNLVFFLFFKI
jgi:hypothetical protein